MFLTKGIESIAVQLISDQGPFPCLVLLVFRLSRTCAKGRNSDAVQLLVSLHAELPLIQTETSPQSYRLLEKPGRSDIHLIFG